MGSTKYIKPKHKRICRICGKEFLAKMINTTVCYSDYCQRELENQRRRKKQ